ncbi:MAG: serine/threonine-protein kinase [Actinomycetota bacterium]
MSPDQYPESPPPSSTDGSGDDARHPVVPGLEIVDVVARGGHGTVFRARQVEHDRIVALKVLDARFVDGDTRRRFDRERVALGRISDHPSIVSLLDSGETEAGAPYLLLEYASGGSLADRLDEGPLDLDEATALIVGLTAAVERTHGAGIVHRDIKPANVMRSAYGVWMLTDFGIASLVDRSTTTSVHVSYAHTAPETFDGDAPTPTADVYSLASVLATCLTGAEPFEMTNGESPVSTMRRVVAEPYPDVRRSGVPDDLATVLEMSLSKDPVHRPVSSRAFGAAVNDVRVAHGLSRVPIRTGDEIAPDATVHVSDEDLGSVAQASWSAGGSAVASDRDTLTSPPTTRRSLTLLFAVLAFAAGFAGVRFGTSDDAGGPAEIPAVLAEIPADADPGGVVDIAVDESDGDEADDDVDPSDADADDSGDEVAPDGADDGDGDGDGNGNGDGPDDGDGNGNGNGPDGDGDGDGNGNGNGNGGGPDGDGDGDGNGNGNGGGGPGNGPGGGGNGPGNGGGPRNGGGGNNGGNGPGNGGGNGPGNGGGGNGPGNGGGPGN